MVTFILSPHCTKIKRLLLEKQHMIYYLINYLKKELEPKSHNENYYFIILGVICIYSIIFVVIVGN